MRVVDEILASAVLSRNGWKSILAACTETLWTSWRTVIVGDAVLTARARRQGRLWIATCPGKECSSSAATLAEAYEGLVRVLKATGA